MSDARAALLAKVVAHFADHGVRDTSLRSLAAAIGTSQRMLHYHFGSREDVLAAVIDAIAAAQGEQIAALFADEPDPFTAGARNWEATVAGARIYGALWFELASHAMHGEPYTAGLGEVMVQSQLRAFTEVYRGYTDLARAERLARLTLAVGQGLIFDLLIDDDRAGADAAVDEFTRMIRRELTPRTPRIGPPRSG